MKNTFILPLVALALAAIAGSAQAETLRLQASKAGDLQAAQLRPAVTAPWQNDSRDRVAVSYALDMDAPLALNAKPEPIESREYWRKVSGAELNRGVDLPTTAPGAMLRVSAQSAFGQAQKNAVLIEPEGLLLRSPQGREQSLSASANSLYQAAKDEPAVLPVLRGGVAAKLDADLGAGIFQLKAKTAVAADTEYLIQVFEPDSPYRLQSKHRAHNVLAGNTLTVDGVMLRDGAAIAAKTATAALLTPDGRRLPLDVRRGKNGSWQIAQALDLPSGDVPGLWEVEWTMKAEHNGMAIERQVRSAFAFAAASARLERSLQFSKTANELRLSVPVTVASPGRYEVRAVVSGKDAAGMVRPIAFAATAEWIDSGQKAVTLQLDKQLLNDAGVTGPLYIQELQLTDQSRLAILHKQAQALTLSEKQWRGVSRQFDRSDRR
ncbi:MAG: DUF4785 domain-containing protein [Permianibacter sp.]